MDLDKLDWKADTGDTRTRSVSQLTNYAGCGEQYRLQRRAKVPQRPAGWFIQGHATHIAIEAWEKDRKISPAELEVLYTDSYINEANAILEEWPEEELWLTGGRKKGFDDLSDRQDKGWTQVLEYMNWAKSEAHLWEVVDVEREFIVYFGDVPVRGYIDQIVKYIDGGYQPRDLKSGTKTPASAVQLITYGIAMEKVMGITVDKAAFVKLANPSGRTEATKATQFLEVDLTEEAAYTHPEFLTQFYRDVDRGIEAGIFIPNPTDGCDRVCGVQQYCRMMGTGSSAEQNQKGLLPLTDITKH